MNLRSTCASLLIAATAISGGAVSASAAMDTPLSRSQATSCADGGRIAVNQNFGPNFKWTLMGIRYSGNQQCNVIITNAGYSGKVILKYKLTDKSGNVIKDSVDCTGCAELPFGTGGYKKVEIKAIAFTRAGDRSTTPWRTVKS